MAGYTKDEFYGDLLERRLDVAIKRMRVIATTIFLPLFAGLLISLWIWPEQTNQFLNDLTQKNGDRIATEMLYRLLAIPGLLVILLPFLPDVVHVVRKYGLYPKSSLTQQSFAPVQARKLIIHPRTRTSNGTPKSYIFVVRHPVSGNLVPVDVDESWFTLLDEGALVHVFYHSGDPNVLYLKRG